MSKTELVERLRKKAAVKGLNEELFLEAAAALESQREQIDRNHAAYAESQGWVEKWAGDCGRLEKERDAAEAKVSELETERNEARIHCVPTDWQIEIRRVRAKAEAAEAKLKELTRVFQHYYHDGAETCRQCGLPRENGIHVLPTGTAQEKQPAEEQERKG